MADFVFNVAKGRAVQFYKNVDDNSPAAAVIRVFIIDNNAETDDNMGDTDDMTALFATLANEVTNANYANKSLDETNITLTLDDSANVYDVDIDDQTFSAIGAGDAWTDLVMAYDFDGSDTDGTTIPISNHDFVLTPDGSDITAQIDAAGIFRAA